ncbi:MAG: hypothetical protein V2B20_04335 [Pseudomonadota bacterium]
MKWAGIALTVVFYSLIVFFGVVLLAAVQLRSSTGATFDTWRLNYEANRSLNANLVENVKKVGEKARIDENALIGNEICLRFFNKGGLPMLNLLDKETVEQIAEAKHNRKPLENLIGDVNCVVKGYSQVQHDIQYSKLRVQENVAEIADLKKSLTSNGEQYADLIKGHQDFLAFMEMEKSWYQRPFVVAPYDLLVLLLIMFMGALGGMVRLLRDYGVADHPNPTTGEYFFIPLIGVVVAIGGYVLAKTGLLLLSSAHGESSLSPFMISLVGIVSGLLAKEVIETIAARGRKMLSGQDGATKPQGGERNG